MQTVTVSDKGQVVIPATIRRQLGITPGCQFVGWVERSETHRVIEAPE